MPGRTKKRPTQDRSMRPDEHPCLAWFRWFVGNCLRTQGDASNRDVLFSMRAILDAALESSPPQGRGVPKSRHLHRRARPGSCGSLQPHLAQQRREPRVPPDGVQVREAQDHHHVLVALFDGAIEPLEGGV